MAKQFKDFNKEVKDLLTKNYPAGGYWKVETKEKAPNRTLTVSTVSEWSAKKQSVAADLDYNLKEYNLKTKTNVNANGNIKPKVTYEPAAGHKVETTLQSLSADADFEVLYEGNMHGAQLSDKVTKKAAELQVSYPVGPLVVGAGVSYGFSKGLQSWSAGARFVDPRVTVNVVTKDLKTFTTGVYVPLKLSCCSMKVAAQVDCGHNKFSSILGVEAPLSCCNLPDVTMRFKVGQDLKCAVAVIKKLANGWTAAVAAECHDITKVGVQLTRE